MAITVDWADFEETVIIWQLRGDWDGDDFYKARTECIQLAMNTARNINLIIDLNFSSRAPNNMLLLVRGLFVQCPPNLEKIVILSQTSFWHRIFEMARTSAKFAHPMFLVDSIEDAYKHAGVE